MYVQDLSEGLEPDSGAMEKVDFDQRGAVSPPPLCCLAPLTLLTKGARRVCDVPSLGTA